MSDNYIPDGAVFTLEEYNTLLSKTNTYVAKVKELEGALSHTTELNLYLTTEVETLKMEIERHKDLGAELTMTIAQLQKTINEYEKANDKDIIADSATEPAEKLSVAKDQLSPDYNHSLGEIANVIRRRKVMPDDHVATIAQLVMTYPKGTPLAVAGNPKTLCELDLAYWFFNKGIFDVQDVKDAKIRKAFYNFFFGEFQTTVKDYTMACDKCQNPEIMRFVLYLRNHLKYRPPVLEGPAEDLEKVYLKYCDEKHGGKHWYVNYKSFVGFADWAEVYCANEDKFYEGCVRPTDVAQILQNIRLGGLYVPDWFKREPLVVECFYEVYSLREHKCEWQQVTLIEVQKFVSWLSNYTKDKEKELGLS